MAAVELAVERHYATVELSEEERDSIRASVIAYVAAVRKVAAQKIDAVQTDLARLDAEERKLLTAHYADQVSESLFAEEQTRIRRERASATKLMEGLTLKHEQVLKGLQVALGLTDHIQAAYCQAASAERRLFNQAFFERLEIANEAVVGHELAEPFGGQERPGEDQAAGLDALAVGWDSGKKKAANGDLVGALPALPLARNARTPSPFSRARGSNVESLVPLSGALLNHYERLVGLLVLRTRLLSQVTGSSRPAAQVRLRCGAIQATIIEVLTAADDPMRVQEVHTAVEHLLSMPVSKDTVNSCLSTGTRGTEARFERLSPGLYRLAEC